MVNVYNPTPGTVSLGVDDQSTRSVPFNPEEVAQKVDLFYIYAKKGSKGRYLGTTADIERKFGSEVFDSLSPYYTHQSDFLSVAGSSGNACVVHRIVPDDAGAKANVSLYIDVLETHIPNYERNSDGSFKLEDGKKVLNDEQPYIKGRKIKWFKKSELTEVDFGSHTVGEGYMAKWDLTKEDEVHLLASETNIDITPNGHTDYANKTVYTYATLEDLYSPKTITTRKRYVVDGEGNRTDEGDDTFDGDKIVKSKLYPIFQVKASHQGKWYNLFGFNIVSCKTKELMNSYLKKNKALTYKFSYKVKQDENSTPKPFKNLNGETSVNFSFQKDAVDPDTKLNLSLEYNTYDAYFNETDPSKPETFAEVEKFYFYRENFEKILRDAIVDEIPHVSLEVKEWGDGIQGSTFSWYDFTTYKAEELPNEFGLLNPFTCTTSKAISLFSMVYEDDEPFGELEKGLFENNMVGGNVVLLDKGTDGTMSIENFEKAIIEDMQNYLDENHEYMDMGKNVENFFWDSGFSLKVKEAISNFIAKKHNTMLGYCTHYDSLGDESLSLAEQTALGATLYNNVRLKIESEEFGTETIRAIIVLGTGRKNDSRKRYPILRDILAKTSRLMGGKTKKWDASQLFDSGEKNVITDLIDIQPSFIPPATKDNLTDNGITYVQNYDRRSYFFPMTRTVYENKTSIAGSFINMLCIPYCERVAFEVWRELTGTSSLTTGQFIREATERASRKLAGAFGGVVRTVPTVTVTQADEAYGYIWRLDISVYGNNAKYKQIYSTTLRRTPIETK